MSPRDFFHARSEEEDDILQISNKRVGAREDQDDYPLPEVEMLNDGMDALSFKEKLLRGRVIFRISKQE